MGQATKGLFDELDLSGKQDAAIFQAVEKQRNEAGLGAGGRPGIAGLGGIVGSFFGKNKGDNIRQGFRRGVQGFKDQTIADAKGITIEEQRKKREFRAKVAAIDIEDAGTPDEEQVAALEEIKRLAALDGQFDVVTRANAKLLQLQKNRVELRSAEIGADAAERENDIAAQLKKETDATGRTMRLVGDDPQGKVSVGELQDDGTWLVHRPDGTIETAEPGQVMFVKPDATKRDRLFETADAQLGFALKLNGMQGVTLTKARSNVEDVAQQAGIIGEMTGNLLNMYNPALAFDASRTALIGADKVTSFVENASQLLAKKTDKDQDNWSITWGGKKVSAAEQFKQATSRTVIDSYLEENDLSLTDILPEHLDAESREAQLFLANVMQLAYLDARLQEPSNRGLSDTDIKNALTRIGINTPDPTVFARRQQVTLNRLRGKIDNLGVEFSGTSQIGKNQIINFVYNQETRGRIYGALDAADAQLSEFLGGGGNQGVRNLSDEELDAQIEAARKGQ